jgi:hypothetical protein
LGLLGICIEGDIHYRPADCHKWMQLQNNVVGVNGPSGALYTHGGREALEKAAATFPEI